jgi:hypothetical protein
VSLEIAKVILDTNYFVVKNFTKALLPLLRDDTYIFVILCHVLNFRVYQTRVMLQLSLIGSTLLKTLLTILQMSIWRKLQMVLNKWGWPNWTKLGWAAPM